MTVAVIIPARYGSTRLPGKPLHLVAGVSLIQRVWRLASAVPGAAVHVATDDARIADHVRGFGGSAILTPADCRDGTERALAAAETLAQPPDVVVNLQGDAVLTPPWVIEAVAGAFAAPEVRMATAATRMAAAAYEALVAAKAAGEVGGTTVTFDRAGNALYFSKAVIPFLRRPAEPLPVWRHIGLYGYRLDVLRRLVSLPPGPLEQVEQLEQLRALENGIPIRVVPVDYRGRTHWAVDSEADIRRAEAIIAAEGELVG